MMSNATEVMRPEQAAAFLNLSKSTLAKMRMRGDGPPFAKLGSKIVVYRVADLRSWLDDQRRQNTAH